MEYYFRYFKKQNLNMNREAIFFIIILLIANLSCQNNDIKYDASGTFEATEIIVSSEAIGKIISFKHNEGDELKEGEIVVLIDTTNLALQMEQTEAAVRAIGQKQNNAGPQIEVYTQQLSMAESQIETLVEQEKVLKKEQSRIQKLFSGDAATAQQVDDINGKLAVLNKQIKSALQQKSIIKSQINATKEQISIQNRGINSEVAPMVKKVELVRDQLKKTQIAAPKSGTILTKYAEEGEFIALGKPLFKLADLTEMSFRAYITGDQLPKLKLGQQVSVFTDDGSGGYSKFAGKVTWIADKAEFTPKTIQTKEERANLVYAVKIGVKNDGSIKIGMYGEVSFNISEDNK